MDILIEKVICQCFPCNGQVFTTILKREFDNRKKQKEKPGTLISLALDTLLDSKKESNQSTIAYQQMIRNEPLDNFLDFKPFPHIMHPVIEHLTFPSGRRRVHIYNVNGRTEVQVDGFELVRVPQEEGVEDGHWAKVFGDLMFLKEPELLELHCELRPPADSKSWLWNIVEKLDNLTFQHPFYIVSNEFKSRYRLSWIQSMHNGVLRFELHE